MYDYLGRVVTSGIPPTVSSSCLFVVLPSGVAGSAALPVSPPLGRAAAHTSASTRASLLKTGAMRPDADSASSIVLEAAFPYVALCVLCCFWNSSIRGSNIVMSTGSNDCYEHSNLVLVSAASTHSLRRCVQVRNQRPHARRSRSHQCLWPKHCGVRL